MGKNTVSVNIEGEKELHAKFKKLDYAARGPVLERAVRAGAEVIQDDANQRAPGPHVIAEILKKESTTNYREIGIGPDKDHWYYQFFETGVKAFVIDKSTGRTTRTGDRGRPVYGSKKALAFDDVVVAKVHRGPMAARPFLRPAFDGQKKHAVAEMGHELMIEIHKACEE